MVNFKNSIRRSALQDSQEAIKINPNYLKPRLRVPLCFFRLENYQECIDCCEKILSEDENNTKIRDLRNSAVEKKVQICFLFTLKFFFPIF